MEAKILDKKFQIVGVVDAYESFIWTDRYDANGDFEIYTTVNSLLVSAAQPDFYIWRPESSHLMVIEKHRIVSTREEGDKLIISGRSAESILDRRIAWGQTIMSGNLQAAVKKLLKDHAITPVTDARKIPGLIFEDSTDQAITGLTLNAQFTGNDLYQIVHDICVNAGIGFKIVLNAANQFVFSLYKGKDRSFGQTTNPHVIFSPEFENLLESDYEQSKLGLKTCALVGGEGEGNARKFTIVGGGEYLDRREMFVDARDISSNVDGGTISEPEYMAQLSQRGYEKLAEKSFTISFEGKIFSVRDFLYDRDFFMGDIVQIVNQYGMQGRSIVKEIIFSHDTNTLTIVPKFEAL